MIIHIISTFTRKLANRKLLSKFTRKFVTRKLAS